MTQQQEAITESKLLSGWYRVSGREHFSNIKREHSGEHAGKWSADLRYSNGDLIQFAGVWTTKRDAVEEAQFLIGLRERATGGAA